MPSLGKYAKQLYVIQRTPSSVDERNNTPTDRNWYQSLPGWQRQRPVSFHHGAMGRFAKGETDLVCDIFPSFCSFIGGCDGKRWGQSMRRILRKSVELSIRSSRWQIFLRPSVGRMFTRGRYRFKR